MNEQRVDMSRRRALAAMGATALSAFALGSRGMQPGVAGAVEDGTNPRFIWQPIAGNPVVIAQSTPQTPGCALYNTGDPEFLQMSTLLPVGYLLNGEPSGAPWYLWAWHHDIRRLHIYVADSPEGPFTEHPSSPVNMPGTGLPAGYDSCHFSDGDIVWDPIGRRFIATPHSFRLGTQPGNEDISQDSFLIQSADGLNWQFLDNDNQPRLLCGIAGTDDSVHTGYGRLLRDLDGNLVKYQNRYWWLYRGQRHDAGDTTMYYRPLLASTPTLSSRPWRKDGRAFTPLAPTATGIFTVGSFVSAADKRWAYYAESEDVGVTSLTYLVSSAAGGIVMDGTRLPVPLSNNLPGALLAGGPNLVRHPTTKLQYLVQDSYGYLKDGKIRSTISIYKSVLP